MQWRFEAATAPAPGSLCEGAAQRCFAAWNIEESNDTSAGPSSKYSQAPPWRTPSQPCYASASRTLRVPGHRRVGVLHDANRWCRQTEAAALAVLLDSGSGKKVPPRGRGACTARTRKVCFEKNTLSATLPSSYASRPRTWWSSTMWMAPDRWQATYTRIDAMEYRPKTAGPPPPPAVLRGGPGSGGRSPVRKGYGSRPTSQTRKQAAVPPEAPVPGMQQGKRFMCTCRCTIPNAPPRAPRRPSGRWRRWSLQCRPLPGSLAIDITEQRGDACVHARQQKWKIWSEARTTRDWREGEKTKQLFEAWKLLRAGHIYAKVHHATMTRCNMATWLMHCSRYMEALRLGREEKMTRRGQGSGVEGDAPGPKSKQAELNLRGRFRVACSKEDGFVCLCANIYGGYTGAWVFVLRVLCNIYNRQKMPERASRAGMNADQRREIFRYLSRQVADGENTPRPFVSIGGTLVITYSHCVSPQWLCKRGLYHQRKTAWLVQTSANSCNVV